MEFYDFKRITRVGILESKGTIFDFDTCPFSPSISAYLNGNLNIVDVREKHPNSVYKNTNSSHVIKWNPIVPYWIATASSTSLNFYDIRYNSCSPLSTIQHGNIHELSWSSGNCDLILATSRDRRTNLWSLNHSEDYCRLGMTMTRFDLRSIVTISGNNSFYGLDDSDSLVKIEIRSEYLNKLAPVDKTIDSEFQIIEESIYTGNFDNFKMKLEEISKESDYNKLKELISLITKKLIRNYRQETFDETLISSITTTTRGEQTYKDENVFKASNNILALGELTEIRNFIDKIRFKIRIIELLSSNDFDSLTKFSSLLAAEIYRNENFLDAKDSIKMFSMFLRNDRLMALNFLKEFRKANPFGISENLKIWIWMFGFPTIFDSKSYELMKIRPSLSKSIVKIQSIRDDDHLELEDDEDLNSNSDSWEDYLKIIRNHFYNSITSSVDLTLFLQANQKSIQQVYLNLEGNPMKFENFLQVEDCLLRADSGAIDEIASDILHEREDACNFIISSELIKILLESSFKNSLKSLKRTFLQNFFLLAFRLKVLTERTPINLSILEFISTVAFSKLKLILSTLDTSEDARICAVNSIVSIGTDPYCTFAEEQFEYLADVLKLLKKGNEALVVDVADFEHVKSVKFRNELINLKQK